jgi:hypothetical protein
MLWPFFLPLFTELPGIGFPRSSLIQAVSTGAPYGDWGGAMQEFIPHALWAC